MAVFSNDWTDLLEPPHLEWARNQAFFDGVLCVACFIPLIFGGAR